MFSRLWRSALLGTGWVLWAGTAPAPKPLAIVRPALHQYEGGPAVPSEFVFLPGDTLFLTCLVQGYKASEDSRIHLRYQIDALDTGGVRLMETAQREIQTDLAPEDKEWMPKIQQSVPVPPLTEPGVFRILVTVQDVVAGSETKAEIPFRVGGRRIEPSDTLVVRGFRFLRSEEDRDALSEPAYRPGDALWARFEIVGYRFGEKNRVQVDYGLSVLGPTGKTLYSEPRAAVEDAASFYPKRYLSGSLSLNLQQNARPGEYTIVLSVRDETGKQDFQGRYAFKIE